MGEEDDSRPFTCANIPNPLLGAESAILQKKVERASSFFGLAIEVMLVDNWGDPSHMGLTSIALLDAANRQPIALRPDQVTVSLPAVLEGDLMTPGEVAKLIDGVDVTTDESHMWVCPTTPHPHSSSPQLPSLTITLDTPTSLGGLRVWNYNTSMEESYKGVQMCGCVFIVCAFC